MKTDQVRFEPYYYYLLAGAIIFFDQVTKILVERYLSIRRSVSLIETMDLLRLSLVTNTGAAWGILKGYNILFVSVAIVVSGGCVWIIQTGKGTLIRLSASGILGGGIGNMLDRLLNSHGVVDFIDIGVYHYRWPAFNFADTMLVVGLAVYFVTLLRRERLINLKND